VNALVVDDDRLLTDLVVDILEEHGHHAVGAYDGNEALERCAANHFDVAIVDLLMPNRDGIELIQDLRARSPGTAIIAMTGMWEYGDQYLRMARKLGADAGLHKPFSFTELIETAERLAGG
jgi:DNA-binding response OmpR family regulator